MLLPTLIFRDQARKTCLVETVSGGQGSILCFWVYFDFFCKCCGSMQEMSWGTLGTVRPFPNFHPDRDVIEIQSALERKGASAATSVHRLLLPQAEFQSFMLCSWLRCGDSGEDPDQSQQRPETRNSQDFQGDDGKGEKQNNHN